MTNVESLKREVEKLTSEELAAFRAWFATYDADAWDRQIESDIKAGKLDRFATEALGRRLLSRESEPSGPCA
jgi:hypothetical protein